MKEEQGYKIREDLVREELKNMNPVEIFEKLFEQEIISYLTEEQENMQLRTITIHFMSLKKI